jgi:hypothetical protein
MPANRNHMLGLGINIVMPHRGLVVPKPVDDLLDGIVMLHSVGPLPN